MLLPPSLYLPHIPLARMCCYSISCHVQRRSDDYRNFHPHQSDTDVPTAPLLYQQVGAVRVSLLGYRARDAQAQENLRVKRKRKGKGKGKGK